MSAVSSRHHDTLAGGVGSPLMDGLLEVCHAISREHRLPNLLATVIEQTLSLTHAQKGVIVLNFGGVWGVVKGIAGEYPVAELRSVNLEDDDDIPRTVVRHVLRTSHAVSLESTFQQGRFSRDPYLQRTRPQSVHCLPLLAANRLIGVLYLENCQKQLTPPEHIDGLSLLAAIIALAIDRTRVGASEHPTMKRAEATNSVLDDEARPRRTMAVTRDGAHAGHGYYWDVPGTAHMHDAALIDEDAPMKVSATYSSLQARVIKAESAEAYLRVILEELPDATVMTTRDGRISIVNRQTENLFGYRRDELIGQSIEILIPERFRGVHTRHRSRDALSPKARTMGQGLQLFGCRRDGSEFPVEVSLSFFETPPGFYILRSIRDVSELRATEQALRASERFSRATLDALTEHICVLDEHGEIVATNAAWKVFASANGASVARVDVGTNYLAVCDAATGHDAEVAHEFAAGIRRVMQGAEDQCTVEYSCHAPHERRWFCARATRFSGEGPTRVVIAHENITELKLAEQALRAAKDADEAARRRAEVARQHKEEHRQEAERRRQVAENLRDVLATLNSSRPLEDVLHFIVTQSRRLLGGQAAALYRRGGADGRLEIQVGDDLPLDGMMNQQSAHSGGMATTSKVAVAQGTDVASVVSGADPDTRDVPEPLVETVASDGKGAPEALAVPVPQPFQSVLAIPVAGSEEDYGSLAIYRQRRQRFTPEETNLAALFGDQAALAVENARLRDKAKEAAVLAERDRIARDLHDAVAQAIFSASIIADSLPRVWERSPVEGKSGLDELRYLTHGALAEMRMLLLELRPTAILEKKLGELIAQLGRALSSRTRIAVAIAVQEEGVLPPDVQTALYRIVQEAINNVAKHADARHIWVQGQVRQSRAVLRVFDDGCGFDVGAVPRGQLGIGIMQERARSVGARLRVHSRPGRGTLVAVTWDETGGRQSDD